MASFHSKLLNPCRRLHRLLKLPFKRVVSIRAFRFPNLPRSGKKKRSLRRYLGSVFRLPRRPSEIDGTDGELRSMTERDWTAPFPSPLTPAYVKLAALQARPSAAGRDGVEEACRSFENYLAEMVVEEGKARDLVDVEELLYCWNGLKSPVFVDLVSTFYGELCKDLFSSSGGDVVGDAV